MSDYVVVHFHADGGQACAVGRRVFPNSRRGRQLAARFAVRRREESEHSCGHKSVRIEYTDKDVGNKGHVYYRSVESTYGLEEEDWDDS